MNYDANTIEEAKKYLAVRYKELASIGITVYNEMNYEDMAVITVYSNGYGSIYILKDFRGQGLYKQLLQMFMVPIMTMEDCKIIPYLEAIKCNHIVVETSPAYKMIREHYGSKTTKRSGVRLMNHIDEGLEILNRLKVAQPVLDAYCLHPILQSDEDFNNNLVCDFSGIDTAALLLAVEYRRVANSYLSTGKIENFVGFTNDSIKFMLYADKVQNEKDFSIYHEGTHPRSKELRKYFDNWLNILLEREIPKTKKIRSLTTL